MARTDQRQRANGTLERDTPSTADRGASTGAVTHEERAPRVRDERQAAPRARQRDAFGGLNWGAAFFGWLVATGMSAILLAILVAAGAATGLTNLSSSAAKQDAATIGIGGGIALVIVLLVAYYAGGYVAGRMSRFDGGRQGFGVWAIGIILILLFAAAGALLGSEYNVLGSLHLPRIPIKEGTLATGGAIALVVAILGTLGAAIVGGRVGRAYHSKVDRAGYVPAAQAR
jgi:hypothetical protein